MKDILEVVRKRMIQKNLGTLSIWAFLTHQVKMKSKDPEQCSWYIKGNTFFVTLSASDDKTQWFIERGDFIDILNTTLEEAWYEYKVKKIRFR